MLPLFTILAIAASAFTSIYLFNALFLFCLALKKGKNPNYKIPKTWPKITIQIPVYNELLVERVLKNITDLDYPKEKLQLQILDDSSIQSLVNHERKLVNTYKKKGYFIQLLHRDNRKGYKAGALNNGLSKAEGELIAIVDVDTILPTDFLRKTIPYFYGNAKLAFVQTRFEHANRWSNWVTRANAVAMDFYYLIEQPVRSAHNLLPDFSGSAGLLRRSIIEDYRWDEHVLAEDVELSRRVQIDGWQSLYLEDIVCTMELPLSLIAFKRQQERWFAGWIQTLKKLWKKILRGKLSTVQKVESLLLLSSPLTYLFAVASILFWALAAIYELNVTKTLWIENPLLSIFMLISSTGPIFSAILSILKSRSNIKDKLLSIPLTILLMTSTIISGAKAVVKGLFFNDLTFERTERSLERLENKQSVTLSDSVKNNLLEIIAAIGLGSAILLFIVNNELASAMPLSFILISLTLHIFNN